MSDAASLLQSAVTEFERAAYRKGFEAGYLRAFKTLVGLMQPDSGWVDEMLGEDLTSENLWTQEEQETAARDKAKWNTEWEQRKAAERAAVIAEFVAQQEAARPVLAPSPEPLPLLLEAPREEPPPEEPTPEILQNRPEPHPQQPVKLSREDKQAAIKERNAIVKREWPSGTPTEEILRMVNALPGPRWIFKDILELARFYKLYRPNRDAVLEKQRASLESLRKREASATAGCVG